MFVVPDIGYIYINLSTLKIVDCGLLKITKVDLLTLKGLKSLYLTNNLIVSLPADLFELTPQLTHICLRDNKIKFISKHTLTPLTQLTFADFRGNSAIDECYDWTAMSAPYSITLCELGAKIFVQCKPPNEQLSTVVSYVQCLWEGLHSDFKVMAKEEVFKVHKTVLAANSPVFAAMFSHQKEESVKNEMTIKNFQPETVKELLAFVYLRKVPDKCFNSTGLYSLAHMYEIQELMEQIQCRISMEVNRENAYEMLKFGVLYSNDMIIRATFQAIERLLHGKNLLESQDVTDILDIKAKLNEALQRIAEF